MTNLRWVQVEAALMAGRREDLYQRVADRLDERDAELARLRSQVEALRGAIEGLIDGAPTDDEMSEVPLGPGQQIKLVLTISSAKIRIARAALAAGREGG